MRISVHPSPYDIRKARQSKSYASFFTAGWQTVETQASAAFSRIVTSQVWSPCIFADGHRLAANFIEARLLVLDFDSPGYPLEQALKEWCDTTHWIGTTKNHQRDKNGITCDRFRIIVPYAVPITSLEQYRYNYAQVSSLYDAADQSTKDGARLFFPCQAVVSVCMDGELQPVLALPDEYTAQHERYNAMKALRLENKIIPRHLRRAFELPIPKGRQNNTIYGTSKELAAYGFDACQLLDMFLTSATYKGQVMSASTIKKITETINNGIKANRREESLSAVRNTT